MFLRILIVLLPIYSYGFACEVDPDLVQLTIDIAKQEGIQPELLIAVVWVESRFCPDAISPAGAIGLGQLMPATASDLKVNPYKTEDNLRGSVRYLIQQFKEFQNWELALAAYNAGPQRVIDASGIPKISETRGHISKVTKIYLRLFQELNKP